MKEKMWKTVILVLTLMVSGCKDHDTKDSPLRSSFIFAEFHVNAEEGMDSVNCRVQFRDGSADGPLVDSAIRVELDGRPLERREAGLSGAWYEVNEARAGFEGNHKFSVAAPSGLKEIPFTFSAFGVSEVIPDSRGWKIILTPGSAKDTRYRISLIDTAFFSNDVNISVTPKGDSVIIPARSLRELASGPVILEMTREKIFREESGSWLGYLNLSYRIRREVSWSRTEATGSGH